MEERNQPIQVDVEKLRVEKVFFPLTKMEFYVLKDGSRGRVWKGITISFFVSFVVWGLKILGKYISDFMGASVTVYKGEVISLIVLSVLAVASWVIYRTKTGGGYEDTVGRIEDHFENSTEDGSILANAVEEDR